VEVGLDLRLVGGVGGGDGVGVQLRLPFIGIMSVQMLSGYQSMVMPIICFQI